VIDQLVLAGDSISLKNSWDLSYEYASLNFKAFSSENFKSF
jgi:nitrogen fixation protein